MKRFFLKNSLHLSCTTSGDLREVLHPGEIHPAQILAKVSENSYRIEILNRRIIAASSLSFTTANVFVQVHALHPQIHLRVIPANLEHIDRILDLAGSDQIELDSFNQWALAEFIKSGYAFPARHLKKDLARIRHLARHLPARHLIPLSRYVRMLENAPELFDKLPLILFSKPFPLLDSRKGHVAAARPEDIIDTLHYCYTHYSLENDCLEQAFDRDGISADLTGIKDLRKKLSEFNAFIHPDYSLSGFLVPCEREIQTILVEGKQDNRNTDPISRYEFPYTLSGHGHFRVNLRFLENMLSVSYFYDTPGLKPELAAFERPARKLAAAYRLKLLPFHYEMNRYRTIL